MSELITYDKNGQKVPSKEFMNITLILLRKAEKETGSSFVSWLESFEDIARDIDAYDDLSLRKTIRAYMDDNYPEKQ